jgi:dethiobiotin synthetase
MTPHINLAAVATPALLVLPAFPGSGATVTAGAIAHALRRGGARVGVCIPIAMRCVHRREGLVSEDAEFLAVCADSPHPLDLIAPVRYAEDLPPNIAARRSGRAVEWESIDRAIQLMSRDADVMIFRAPATLLTPLDDSTTALDLARKLRAPIVAVTRAGGDAVNQCSMMVAVAQSAGVRVAGIVVNRYPAESASIAEEASLREIEKWSKSPLLCVLPEERFAPPALPPGIVAAAGMVDWTALMRA